MLIMNQELSDELGAPVDEELLRPTVSKQWILHGFCPPRKTASMTYLPLPECDCTLTEYEVWDEFILSIGVVQKVDSEPLITADIFFPVCKRKCNLINKFKPPGIAVLAVVSRVGLVCRLARSSPRRVQGVNQD